MALENILNAVCFSLADNGLVAMHGATNMMFKRSMQLIWLYTQMSYAKFKHYVAKLAWSLIKRDLFWSVTDSVDLRGVQIVYAALIKDVFKGDIYPYKYIYIYIYPY